MNASGTIRVKVEKELTLTETIDQYIKQTKPYYNQPESIVLSLRFLWWMHIIIRPLGGFVGTHVVELLGHTAR